MAAQRILRIPFSDDLESFVLVNAIRTGKTELNLKLVATEGEDPFVGSSMLLPPLRVLTHSTKKTGEVI